MDWPHKTTPANPDPRPGVRASGKFDPATVGILDEPITPDDPQMAPYKPGRPRPSVYGGSAPRLICPREKAGRGRCKTPLACRTAKQCMGEAVDAEKVHQDA